MPQRSTARSRAGDTPKTQASAWAPRRALSALGSPSYTSSARGRVMDGAGRAARRCCVHHVHPIATRGSPTPYPTASLGSGPCHARAQLHPQTLPIVNHVTANSHGLRARRVLRRPARAPVHNHHRQSRPSRVRGRVPRCTQPTTPRPPGAPHAPVPCARGHSDRHQTPNAPRPGARRRRQMPRRAIGHHVRPSDPKPGAPPHARQRACGRGWIPAKCGDPPSPTPRAGTQADSENDRDPQKGF